MAKTEVRVDRDELIQQGFAFGDGVILPVEDWETWKTDA